MGVVYIWLILLVIHVDCSVIDLDLVCGKLSLLALLRLFLALLTS